MKASNVKTLTALNNLILDLLLEMERETGPYNGDVEENYPIGLWWYSEHRYPGRKKIASEVAWSQRMAEKLRLLGIDATSEHRFPDSAKRCDVVCELGWRKPVWIELKASWREKFDPFAPNTAYLKHLRAASDDILKLQSLNANVASATAFVLIGFERAARPISNDHLSVIRENARAAKCKESYRSWDVDMKIQFKVRCWVWSRELK